MKNIIKITLCVLMLMISGIGLAQNTFNKGVNLSNWFQANSVKQLQFTKFSKQDIQNIKSLGCDVIRFPLNLHAMTNGAPNYIISPLFFQFLDSVVSWAEELQIHIILDNHTFDPKADTPLDFDIPLRKEWIQMAKHYKNRSNYVLYEILNEPHGNKLTTAIWGKMQKTVIDTIRTVDIKHTIVVGASNFNSYTEMKNIPVYADTNLIYTFHFYDPFMFTHQGASWVTGMDSLAGVPYPYNAATMPVCPPTSKGTWVETDLKKYPITGTDSSVKSLIDIAIAFRDLRKVKIYCGEYGVFNLHSNNADRVYWYGVVRNYLDANSIPWTTWDYQGGFGLFVKGSSELFNYDLNIPLVQTLGFIEPTQIVYKKLPDSVGFSVYTDYIEKNIVDDTWADTSALDFYNTQNPNNGSNCILFQDTIQYDGISLKFTPVKDLSLLKSNNYAIDFLVRGNNPKSQFEIRFVDNKTADTATHSWRMSYEVIPSVVAFDNRWHHVRIPFSQMKETGAWDEAWSNPRAKFDWTSIAYLQIRNEQKALPTNSKFWFDNIVVTNLDTAEVYDTTKLVEPPKTFSVLNNDLNDFKIYPNPTKQQTTISYQLLSEGFVDFSIYNVLGQKVCTLVQTNQNAGFYSINWQTEGIPSGFYVCRLKTESGVVSVVVLKE
jgi:endoglucanase